MTPCGKTQIVAEVIRRREEIAARRNYDLKAISLRTSASRQAALGKRLVTPSKQSRVGEAQRENERIHIRQLDQCAELPRLHLGTRNHDPPGRIYETRPPARLSGLPAFVERTKSYEHHLVSARSELPDFGIADSYDVRLANFGKAG